MTRCVIESPFAGDVTTNLAYLRACMRDCFARGEAPFASHALYPTVLDDLVPEQRSLGIGAGLAWARVADLTAIYMDLGISRGMKEGIQHAQAFGRTVEYRSLGDVSKLTLDPCREETLRKRAYDAECELTARDLRIAELEQELRAHRNALRILQEDRP